MKKRTSFKYINVYTFIIILTLIGFVSGMKYYDYQTEEYKTELKESIDLQKREFDTFKNLNLFKPL